MPRDIPIGNGSLLVAFDKNYLIREFHFPHVGQENHAGFEPFRFGAWVNGRFGWLPDGWEIRRDYLDDSLVTEVELLSGGLGLLIRSSDLVDFHENIFLRKMTVQNLSTEEVDARLFFCHDFHIYGNDIGDTAAYRPEVNGLLHYKDRRYFLVNLFANKKYGIDHYAAGNKEQTSFEGTWRDAEDGKLSSNEIAQGSVDSVAAVHLRIGAGEREECFYWICAGRDWDEVRRLDSLVRKKSPGGLFKRTYDYWKLWADKEEMNCSLLPDKLARLYKRSLLILRTNIDNCGSIIAANDSDAVYFNRDTYSYMWPRDGALTAYALDMAGYHGITRRFFDLCGKIIEREGYFLHKYTPSGAAASSWHPWLKGGRPQLPIQEDETALVLWALWNHYRIFRDIEFIKPLYRPLIKSAAEMMISYRDSETGLPLPSYDLWEERQGILTFTAAAVYGGLTAAANFTRAFGETDIAEEYDRGAKEVREGMDEYLWLPGEGRFARMIKTSGKEVTDVDGTIDASLYGIFAFGAYQPRDEKVKSTMEQVYGKLWCGTAVGGLARYEGDTYYRVRGEHPGNPWFVATLWLAQYYIATAADRAGLVRALEIMEWVADRALPSGVLAEQVNPYTNEPLSVSPLTWSHASYVIAVQEYLDKLLEVERCTACNGPKYSKKRRNL